MPLDDPSATTYSQIFTLTELVSAPLIATVQGDFYAAERFVRYLRQYGFDPPLPPPDGGEVRPEDFGTLKMVTFDYQTPTGWSRIRIPLISMVPLPLLQVSDADYRYNIRVLGSSDKLAPKSRDPRDWALGPESLPPPMEPQHLMASFAPLSAQKGDASQDPTLVANMDISIRMRQADLPAGIATLLNVVQGAVEGQSRNRLFFDRATGEIGPGKDSASYTVTVLDRSGKPAAGQPVSLRVTPPEKVLFLEPLAVTRGKLIDQPEPYSVNAASDGRGMVAVEIRRRVLPGTQVEASVRASAEIDMGSGQFAAEKAGALLQVFPAESPSP